ncbi:hypothetical protein BB561_006571 [Smittium simulii]|uniref:Reverse transcriptase domain-containing protein n=1 Tax=Smittium simulii TaxID=133385 RepID=A0A2T9Y333_9FUNG|nr:hypothetical protein BB561_006571 [Smittium simulii]
MSKNKIGRGFTPISNRPILDTVGTLIVEQNQKLLIWSKHFEGLADDSTENSRTIINNKKYGIQAGIANKLNAVDQKYSILDKEQAGFDFAKAYDKVPHQAIINKIQSMGIGGRLLNLIQVRVPGMKSKIPGLLFADDAVVLAESSEEMQLALDNITTWSDLHEIEINNIKCAMYGTYSFLKNQNITTAIRLKVLQSVLIPIGTYGGELFGMTDLIRQPLKDGSSTWVSGTLRLQRKYNINIEQGATRATVEARNVRNDRSRISSWLKNHKMKNSSKWISLHLLYPELRIGLQTIGKIRAGSYWTTERRAKSQLIAKMYREKCPCCNANVPETIEPILIDCYCWTTIGSKKSLLQLRKEKESNMLPSMELQIAKLMGGIRVARTLIFNGIKRSPTPLSQCPWVWIYPELKTHINYVFKIQNETYWTARCYAKSRFIENSRWQVLRADILAQYINIYRAQVAKKPPLLPASISMRLVGKLLGEELKLSSTRIRKDPTVLCVKTTLATAKFLNAIALSRYLMLNSIRLAPFPPNQCPPGTETLVSQRRVNR